MKNTTDTPQGQPSFAKATEDTPAQPENSAKTYSNPQTSRTIENWPFGSNLRTTAMFYIETDPKRGQRACRRTVDPRNGTLSAPKKLTFADRMRIVDGSNGKTYILEDNSRSYDHLTVMQSNMKFQEESIYKDDPRFAQLKALFDQDETPEPSLCQADIDNINAFAKRSAESEVTT